MYYNLIVSNVPFVKPNLTEDEINKVLKRNYYQMESAKPTFCCIFNQLYFSFRSVSSSLRGRSVA